MKDISGLESAIIERSKLIDQLPLGALLGVAGGAAAQYFLGVGAVFLGVVTPVVLLKVYGFIRSERVDSVRYSIARDDTKFKIELSRIERRAKAEEAISSMELPAESIATYREQLSRLASSEMGPANPVLVREEMR